MKKKMFFFLMCLGIHSLWAQNLRQPYDFPVKPGTPGWANLRTTEEIYNATQIPLDILKQLSTEALAQTCLQYPNLLLMYAFNDLQTGFQEVRRHFNGFEELLNRQDAGTELLKIFQQMNAGDLKTEWNSEELGRIAVKFQYIEVLLSQPEVINSLSDEDAKKLISECLNKYDSKAANELVYAIPGLQSTCLVIARVLFLKKMCEFDWIPKAEDIDESQLKAIYDQAKKRIQ